MVTIAFLPLFAALLASVSAQTPPGTNPAAPQNLRVTYGANDVTPAGKRLARPETAKPPTIQVPANMISPTQKALLVMLDLDVPRNNQRVTNLHWLSPNVDISQPTASVPTTPPGGLAYRQPSPPPGDTPHRYVYYLYAQAQGFTVPAQSMAAIQMRLGFDVNAFAVAGGLGQPVAANFITVQT